MRGVWNPASLTCLGVVMEPAAPRASPGSVSCRPVIPGSEGTFAPPAVPWDETVPDGLSAGGGAPSSANGRGWRRHTGERGGCLRVCLIVSGSQPSLAVGAPVPTSVTLTVVSSVNPLPSDQPLELHFGLW